MYVILANLVDHDWNGGTFCVPIFGSTSEEITLIWQWKQPVLGSSVIWCRLFEGFLTGYIGIYSAIFILLNPRLQLDTSFWKPHTPSFFWTGDLTFQNFGLNFALALETHEVLLKKPNVEQVWKSPWDFYRFFQRNSILQNMKIVWVFFYVLSMTPNLVLCFYQRIANFYFRFAGSYNGESKITEHSTPNVTMFSLASWIQPQNDKATTFP
jgi:hypothetical protein